MTVVDEVESVATARWRRSPRFKWVCALVAGCWLVLAITPVNQSSTLNAESPTRIYARVLESSASRLKELSRRDSRSLSETERRELEDVAASTERVLNHLLSVAAAAADCPDAVATAAADCPDAGVERVARDASEKRRTERLEKIDVRDVQDRETFRARTEASD